MLPKLIGVDVLINKSFFVVVYRRSLLFCFRNFLFDLIFLFKADMNPVLYQLVYRLEI